MNERLREANRLTAARAQKAAQEAAAQGEQEAFEYDAVFDKLNAHREAKQVERSDASGGESKYISRLLETAKQREMTQEQAREKAKRREMDKEAEAMGPADEVFVTGAYKRKLEEQRKWEAEVEARDKEDEKNDVTKKDSLTGFYSNMLDGLSGKAPSPDTSKGSGTANQGVIDPPSEEQRKNEQLSTPADQAAIQKSKSHSFQAPEPKPKPGFKAPSVATPTVALPQDTLSEAAPESKVTPEQLEAAKIRALERFNARSR